MTVTIGSDGSISIPLIPNTGASPSGSYYRVFLKLDDGTTSEEQWVVPAVATTTVAAIRAQVVPQAVAAQFVSRDYVDTLLYRSGSNTLSTPGSLELQSSITASSPVVDIRAYGAVIDGATDIGPALTAAISQACSSSGAGVILLPCGGTGPGTGCYLANPSTAMGNITGCSSQASLILRIQGTVKLGSTLIAPQGVSLVCEGGGFAGEFTPRGPNCGVTAPQVYGSMGTAISAPGVSSFTPTFGSGAIASLPVNSAITIADTMSCNITSMTRNSSGMVTATLSAPQCRIPADANITIAGAADPTYNKTVLVSTADYAGATMSWVDTGVTSVSVTSGGSGYTSAPAVSFSGGSCGAVAGTATVSGGVVTAVNLTNQGLGCLTAPTVVLTGGGGSGATAAAAIWTAGSTTGGTVTGFNDDTFETVSITANTGTTVSANFAHAHSASAVWGAVGISAYPGTYGLHYFQGVSVGGNYGAGWWFPSDSTVLLDGVGGGESSYMSSIPIEFASTWGFHVKNSTFLPTLGHFCGTGCGQQGYPYGVRLTSLYGSVNSSSTTWDEIDGNTFVGGGIKIDNNDQTGFAGELGGLQVKDVVFEQLAGPALMVDSRYTAVNNEFTLTNDSIQDNFNLNSQYLLGYTDPVVPWGSVNFISPNPIEGQLVNQYYSGSILVNGGQVPTLPRNFARIGELHDGNTVEQEFRGEGATFGPQIIPYATINVTTNPTSWLCSGCTVTTGLEAPDGSMTAGELVSTAGGGYTNVASYSPGTFIPQVGDWVIAGVWTMPGTNTTANPAQDCYQCFVVDASSASGSVLFDNTGKNYVYPQIMSTYYGDFWHPVVLANKVTYSPGTRTTIYMNLEAYNTVGVGNRFWQPFLIYVPVSAKPSTMTTAQWDAEIARWRQWLLHGVVPPNMPARDTLNKLRS